MNGAIGIDVGGTFVKAVRITTEGEVADRSRTGTPQDVDRIVRLVGDLAESMGSGLPVGVGLAGLVDHARGVLVWAPHLPGTDVPVADLLAGRLGMAVLVDNDANLAALAEQRLGSGAGSDHVLMLTLGTGIGMGMVLGGRLYRGRSHGGEVGHIVVDPDGETCPCGRSGCWETKVSGRRLTQDARLVLGDGASPDDLMAAARRGHPEASERVASASEWLGIGIEALALAFDPEVVVVGGAAAQAADLLLDPARRRVATTEGVPHRSATTIRASTLGADAGAIGAAVAAQEAVP